jgi:hypothetical protein
MQDYEFETLKVRASVTPQSENWPSPDVNVSIMGDQPTIKGELHWSALHDCVSDARTCVLKAFGAMAAIDEDQNLSPTGKAEKKKEIATKATTALEKSGHLAKARSAVEVQVKHWEKELGLSPKAPDAAGAMLHAEIRSHLASMKSGDRLAFVNAHLGETEVANAVLTAPAFLSGLTPAELGIVKQRVETLANPEIAKSKADTLNAMKDAERGWRNAANQIRARGGLEKSHDGGAE